MLKTLRRGQTALEYIILLIVIIGAFLGIQNYFKRGIQGKWKSVLDELGDQYDPRTANSKVFHTIVLDSQTNIFVTDLGNGTAKFTRREDFSSSEERRTGNIAIGGF